MMGEFQESSLLPHPKLNSALRRKGSLLPGPDAEAQTVGTDREGGVVPHLPGVSSPAGSPASLLGASPSPARWPTWPLHRPIILLSRRSQTSPIGTASEPSPVDALLINSVQLTHQLLNVKRGLFSGTCPFVACDEMSSCLCLVAAGL